MTWLYCYTCNIAWDEKGKRIKERVIAGMIHCRNCRSSHNIGRLSKRTKLVPRRFSRR